MGGKQRLQQPADHLLGGAGPLDLRVELLGRLVRLRVAGLVDGLAAGDERLDDLPVLAHVAQAAAGELVRVAVEDQQRQQLRDRRGDLRRVVAELQLAAELEVGRGRGLLRLGALLALLSALLLLAPRPAAPPASDSARVAASRSRCFGLLLELVELEADAVGDEDRVGDVGARPEAVVA